MPDLGIQAAMIRDENRWPGETLCLKRKAREGEKNGVMGYAAFGVITTSRPPLIVYLREDFVREERFDSVEDLLAAGWVVD